MIKQYKDFISIWNHNVHIIHKSNNSYSAFYGKTHQELFDFCIKDYLTKYNDIGFKKIILFLDNNKIHLDEIIDKDKFIENLYFRYHINTFGNKSKNKTFIYEGEDKNNYDVIIERKIVVSNNKITPKKVYQKDIDYNIMKLYFSLDHNNFMYNSYNNPYEFIFYQISLYKNSIIRIKKWFDLSKKNGSLVKDIKKLKFLSKLYFFFKEYNKLDSLYERLTFWHKNIKQDSNFIFFQNVIEKNDVKKYGEQLIKLFKEDYLNLLISNFESNKSKSINEVNFIKNQIKDFKLKLNQKPEYSFESYQIDHSAIYKDLVNGKRGDYYYDVSASEEAGKTEAIQYFITYLENLTIGNKKSEVKLKPNTFNNVDLLPIEIFENTRGYLNKNAVQINICYKYKAYDACFILLRKVSEILIIELYEKNKLEEKIQDSDGNYFMLKRLITSFQNEKVLKKVMSRNINEYLPKIKASGDLSAHNRKFNARKPDIDLLRTEFRVVFEELVNSIY